VLAVSSYLQTKPIGGPEQPDYLNAVAIVESELPAKDLLALLNGIETAMGRTREIPWGPRVIDLDLIQFGGLLVNDEKLTLPHPRAHERRFVLAPWFEIEPEAVLLTHGRISDLLKTDLE
jgi:2-amino-4-hydroxy-6-hydroxymethyldihydropteridine diphosphokinase